MTGQPLRSFVRREGHFTPAQRAALERLLPAYLWPQPRPASPAEVFGREARCVLEIGFGNGDNLLEQASRHPEQNFIGLEVHRPGVGSLLRRVESAGLENLRVATDDALEFLPSALPAASLDVIQLFFPDPWPKKRHHKRRLVRDTFLLQAAQALRPGGLLLLATDWDNYAEQMQERLRDCASFDNLYPDGPAPRAERLLTRFELRGMKLGHQIHDFAYQRR